MTTSDQVPDTMQPFARTRTVQLETKKRDGSWVPTPVTIVVRGDRAYFRTYAKAGKTKRLRNFPEVRLRPATVRGTPAGEMAVARARLLGGDEDKAAARLLAGKYPLMYGFLVPVAHRFMRTATMHYELTGFQPAP
jgi:uncharacterized protein